MSKEKIVFVVNEHPNEAFAIPVAMETAKRLRKEGYEVIWKKTRFDDTLLGEVWRNPKAKISEGIRAKIHNKKYQNILEMKKKHKTDLIYTFHCTPHNDPFWISRGTLKKPDFEINRNGSVMLIEVRAYYKKIPKKYFERTKIARNSLSHEQRHYLKETTSHTLTKAKGLTPKEFGKAIAKKIDSSIQEKKIKEKIFIPQKGIIPKVFPKRKKTKVGKRAARRRP